MSFLACKGTANFFTAFKVCLEPQKVEKHWSTGCNEILYPTPAVSFNNLEKLNNLCLGNPKKCHLKGTKLIDSEQIKFEICLRLDKSDNFWNSKNWRHF